MKFILVLFLFGYAQAGVTDSKLSAQIQADKLRHHQQSQLYKRTDTTASASSGRILRQQPPTGVSYQYPQPQPSFFLPTQSPSNTVAVQLPAQPVQVLVAQPAAQIVNPPTPIPLPQPINPTQPPVVIPITQYLPPDVPAVVTTTTTTTTTAAPSSPQPVVEQILVQAVPLPAVVSPTTTTTSTTTTKPSTTTTVATSGLIASASAQATILTTGGGMNMALMPQQPTVQMAQIVAINVDCAKESMVVKIKFDRPFGGLIYSKGFHSNLDCHHVRYNTNRDSYQFTIRLNSCGSKWVDELTSGGKAYLENIIIIQNEPGIQEIWDTSRSIRCNWEGSLEKTVKYAFNIDMLDTQIVTFSGDTASATMDIQIGKGPLAPSVNGLVKIGDTLTMVISVEGDPGFDVQVQDCIAHDGDRANAVTLTDNRGCVLKKKLMGPWQKSTQTGRPGVSLVAFSFFQAFKFPDVMEVFLECNVELCKSGCDVCPEDAALFDVRGSPLRNRRSALFRGARSVNGTNDVSDVRLRRSFRVISNEDIDFKPDSRSTVTLTTGNRLTSQDDVCMSQSSFVVGIILILVVLFISCIMTALLCIKMRMASVGTESIYPPSSSRPSSYHAFSSSASKA